MTDNEIIKALKCCSEANNCCKCEYEPTEHIKGTVGCANELSQLALSLINRQKAEIEEQRKTIDSFTTIGKLYSEIKAEAIKEFAERLKAKFIPSLSFNEDLQKVVTVKDIDNLVKEMVGDGDG